MQGTELDDPLNAEFARAALDEFERLQRDAPGVLKEALEGAQMSAEQLSVEPFQGVLEVVQNADDLHAKAVRVALRQARGQRTLLFVHDGDRVHVNDVLPMALAYLSTKRDDPDAIGRHGIGLKTLGRIGQGLSVHCPPYHFAIDAKGGGIRRIPPARSMKNFYNAASTETLLQLRLRPDFDVEGFHSWFSNLGARALIFLNCVRSLRLARLNGKRAIANHRLREVRRDNVTPRSARDTLCRIELRDVRDRRSWIRYDANVPVPHRLSRRYKAMRKTTPVSIAIPRQFAEYGGLYAGLPLGIHTQLPFGVSAQFDVDTARRGIQHEALNSWLFERIRDVCVAAAVDRFDENPAEAWQAVPLASECTIPGDEWLSGKVAEMVRSVHVTLRSRIRISAGGSARHLRDVTYEDKPLDGLIRRREGVGLQPDRVLLPANARDRAGRWREVLAELGQSKMIAVPEALELFDWDEEKLGSHDVDWFIRLARAALDEGLGESIWSRRCVVTADGDRIVPPMPDIEGELLLRSAAPQSLAARLGLAHVIDPAYLRRSRHAIVVREWLEAHDMLRGSADPDGTLRALASQDLDIERSPVDDETLRMLRNAFLEADPDDREALGEKVGRVITIDVTRWVAGKRRRDSAHPSEAYLPASIEDRTDGWGKAAGKAPSIAWVDPRYEKVLRGRRKNRTGAERGLGALRFLRLLGAEVAPRLVEPAGSVTLHDDPASPIDGKALTASQREAVANFSRWVTHLKGDRLSPDLVSVLDDIRRERKLAERRSRVNALVQTLEREWDRLYSDHLSASAVYSQYTWRRVGDIPATWIAGAIDEPWLMNEARKRRSPRDLAVRTRATEAIFGDDRERFARELEPLHTGLQVVHALGIETDPQVSEIVDQLRALREGGEDPDGARAALRYAAIAEHCRATRASPDDMVGDLTVRQLRGRFGSNPRKPGLIFAGGEWLPPKRVLLGESVFGDRRVFVPEKSAARALWSTLGISKPTLEDCIDVLKEIAAEPHGERDEQTLLNTYLYLDRAIDDTSPGASLKSLPLWTGVRWETERPVYVVNDPEVADQLGESLPLWKPPIAPSAVPALVSAVDAHVLSERAFAPVVPTRAYVDGASVETLFRSAVELLQDWLARNDPELSGTHTHSWEEMSNPRIAMSPQLRLELQIGRQIPISVTSRAHVSLDPLTLYFADFDEVGNSESGGRVVASLFEAGDKQKLALAWSDNWQRATRGERGLVGLVEGSREGDTLDDLMEQARHTRSATPRRAVSGRQARDERGDDPQGEILPHRRLKTLDQFAAKTVEQLADNAQREVTKRGHRGLKDDLPRGSAIGEKSVPVSGSAPLAYSDAERDQLALEVLQLAINGEHTELRDFRHLRGIGADALDELRRFFEIKASYGPLPDQVNLTPDEAERAFIEGDKFFLAVVAGLEDGYETVVRIYSDPLRTLDRKWSTSTTLEGITGKSDAGFEVRWADTVS